MADGRFLVVDGGTAELRFFDPKGEFLSASGGRGDGPSEFQEPTLVPGLGEDSTFIFDPHLNRFSRLSSTGAVVSMVSPALRMRGTAVGVIGPRVLLQSPVLLLRLGGDGAQPIIPAALSLLDPATGETDTLSVLEGGQLVTIKLYPEYASVTLPNPFRVVPVAALGSNGFFVNAGKAPEIVEYDRTGGIRRVLRIDEATRTITSNDLDQAAKRQATELGDSDPAVVARLRGLYDQLSLPDLIPTFRRLVVDHQGWLWAEVHQVGANPFEVFIPGDSVETEWVIFDPQGRANGILETPAGLYVREIGPDYVLGIHVDELGVQTVRRHRLERRP